MVSHATRKRLSGPGLRTFERICARWNLTERDRRCLLGYPSKKTYRNWVATARDGDDIALSGCTLMRIALVLAIYEGLAVLYGEESRRAEWLQRNNSGPPFGGRSPVGMLKTGTAADLWAIAGFLKSRVSGN